MSLDTVNRFEQKLKQQIDFLQNSCRAFDNGNWNEAMRIATSVRIILHDTPNSTSILKHLNAKNINLFTTYWKPPDGENGYAFMHVFNMGVIDMGKGKFGYGPNLEDFHPDKSRVLPVEEWWNQVVWVISPKSRLTRKRLVLSAANQDGGTHVDSQLNKHYEKLVSADLGSISVTMGGVGFRWPIKNMHLVAIRTIGNELLKSPELLNLIQ